MLSVFKKYFSKSNLIESKFFDLQNVTRVKNIFNAINDYSPESEIRYVGGCVRKILNNEKVDDIDLATNLNPDEIKQALHKKKIKFYETGIEHGTITAYIENEKYEITSLRSDISSDGRHAKVKFTKDWIKDAERRDFTINCIYADLNGNLFDPFNGKNDLKNGKIVFVGEEEKRIQEDYLRILRYLRFFSIYSKSNHDGNTLRNIKKNLRGISQISSERLLDEFKKIFNSQSLESLCLNNDSFLILKLIFPQFKHLEIIKKLNPKMRNKLKDLDYIFLLGVLTIDESDNLDYFLFKFNISKKNQKRIINIKDFFYSRKTEEKFSFKLLRKYFYIFGKESLIDILNYKLFFSKADKKLEEYLEYFQDKRPPIFPIKAEYLMKKFNLLEGKKLGDYLKLVEKHWIDNDFNISEEEIEKIIKN